MNYLLDTHVLIWSLFSPSKLSRKVAQLIQATNNNIYVSAVSYWEISLKFSLGKLDLTNISPENIPVFVEDSGFQNIELDSETAASFYQLPKSINTDPFDRLLVWQSIRENKILISKDNDLKEYEKFGLKVVW